MLTRRLFAAALVFATVACNSTDPGLPRENYALFYTDAQSTSSGFVTLPIGTFFRSSQLDISSSVNSPDQCIDAQYVPGNSSLGGLNFLEAGQSITVASGGESRTMTPVTLAGGGETYQIASGGGLPYAPGDTITFTVPGASGGFPSFSIRARTAESFTFEEPATPTSGQPIVLSWTPASVAGSSMLVSLRYASTQSQNDAVDRQIYCDLVDDGSFSVPASVGNNWRVATTRETVMARWRTEVKQVDDQSIAVVSSTFTVPTPGSSPSLARSLATPVQQR